MMESNTMTSFFDIATSASQLWLKLDSDAKISWQERQRVLMACHKSEKPKALQAECN